MPDDMVPSKRLRAGDADRDAVLQILQQAHAEGRLSVEELGERQDRALQARFTDEFDDLVEDLPEGRELVAGVAPVSHPARRRPRDGAG